MKVHLDTDLGGNPDDACALAMVVGWPGAELNGVTTVADPDGRRAGYVRHLLRALGRDDIPVAAGAARSTTGTAMGAVLDHARYWGRGVVPPVPGPIDAALDLLQRSIEAGCIVIAIGPFTNLALLERRTPGALRNASVTVMGGWIDPPAAGLPAWPPARDWNVQCDTRAAELVSNQADLTLSLLPASMPATLRERDLPRLRSSGPVGKLLALQSATYAADHDRRALGRRYGGLPDDLVNFQWDPVACAVALGWQGVTVEPVRLRPTYDADTLRWKRDGRGRSITVLTEIDAGGFTERWLSAVERAQASAT